MDFRIGQGFDVHRFAQGRKCILAGIEIPNAVGLDGHSDADVVTHALMDAILGALGESDIGTLFPDTDMAYKDADSIELLKRVWKIARERGWRVVNTDLSLLAEVPRVQPYVGAMRDRISGVLECDRSQVTIKATTTEKMGFIGRREGVVASAVILIQRSA